MERLTKRDSYGHWHTNAIVYDRGLSSKDGITYYKAPDVCAYDGEPIDRLAAYEDTGLTPDEIECNKFASKVLLDMSANHQATYEHINDLLKAEREGRCVVRPDCGKCRYQFAHYSKEPCYSCYGQDAIGEKGFYFDPLSEAEAALKGETK